MCEKNCDRPRRHFPGLPWYQSARYTVQAAKIMAIESAGQYGYLVCFHARFVCYPVSVSGDWMKVQKPVLGGYFVIYEDGSEVFLPASYFEENYKLSVCPEPPEPEKKPEKKPVENNTGIGLDIFPFLGLELRPRSAVLKARRREIECAIGRRCKKNYPIPADWVREYVTIVKELFDEKRRTDV